MSSIPTTYMCPAMQAISNSLWSYSKLGYNPGHRVLDIAARRAAVMLHQYTSQEIANTLWAFATLEQNPGSGMLDAAAMQMSRRIEQFSPQVCVMRIISPWHACPGSACCSAGVICPFTPLSAFVVLVRQVVVINISFVLLILPIKLLSGRGTWQTSLGAECSS